VNETWKSFIQNQGAVLEGNRVQHFGHPAEERRAAAGGHVLADLSDFSLIRARGGDTQNFLNGQLSNDLRRLDALILRGARNVLCRVFPPSSGQRAYLIILERDRVREQFLLSPRIGAGLGSQGLELAVQTEVRTALHNLDRLAKRRAFR